MLLTACAASRPGAPAYTVDGDAIKAPLTAAPANAERGHAVVAGREGNCLLCHAIPDKSQRFMGNVAPPLAGVGTRLTPAQIRLRIVDPTRVKPDVAMPAYYRTWGLDRVMEPYRGRTVLSAQQIEDVIAYLVTLR